MSVIMRILWASLMFLLTFRLICFVYYQVDHPLIEIAIAFALVLPLATIAGVFYDTKIAKFLDSKKFWRYFFIRFDVVLTGYGLPIIIAFQEKNIFFLELYLLISVFFVELVTVIKSQSYLIKRREQKIIAKQMLQDGEDYETIKHVTKLDIDELEEIGISKKCQTS